ncbi:MAG TPA: DUF421 domain-containing protein [Chitinophagaceae bacterium]|nr:DUF421 domain-containing protein [Chitinophagaceae bacterium]HNF72223.1 DUF421 domain-containing protein [Chitinophagaceae bacterium]
MLQSLFKEYNEIIWRSVAVYLFIVIAIRLFGKKELAQLSVIDLVFILLISNSVQNAMVGDHTDLGGGLLAALALFTTNFLLKRLFLKNQKVSEFIQGKAVVLIYDGTVQAHNLEATSISIEELEAAVREHGVLEIAQVTLAMLEVDGNISIISDAASRSLHQTKNKHKLKGRILKN